MDPYSKVDKEIILATSSKFLRDWIKKEYLESRSKKGIGLKQILIEQNSEIENVIIIHINSD